MLRSGLSVSSAKLADVSNPVKSSTPQGAESVVPCPSTNRMGQTICVKDLFARETILRRVHQPLKGGVGFLQ